MKSFFLTLLACCLFAMTSFAQTWNGAISSNWNDPNNWAPNAVPTSTSAVVINNVGFSPKLQSNVTIGVITVNPGVTLDFNGYSMTVLSGIGGYTLFSGATLINTNGATDIVLNITTGIWGYNAIIQGCTINDKITINIAGSDVFYEGVVANQFNGDVMYNVNAALTTHLSYGEASHYGGNFSFTRTVAGSSYIFSNAADVAGNFTYQNIVGGVNLLGNVGISTPIGGTCNINISYPSPNSFSLRRFKNLTLGGNIQVQNSQGFDVQDDTLKLMSLSIQGYRANSYAYFHRNKIEGNVTLEDDVSYAGGYNTTIEKNQIDGNATFTVNGSNNFYEASGAGNANVFNGNSIFNLNSGASAYISYEDKTTFNGNLSIIRTVGGYTRSFNAGATISGNFSYTNTSSGDNDIGNLATATNIAGTLNMNVNLASVSGFAMHRLINQTVGGKINVYNSRGFNLQNDTLKVDSLNLKYYRGNGYAYFFNNLLNGHLTMRDSANYAGGYNTTLENNTINGNATFSLYGINPFNDALGVSGGNIYNGNTIFNLNSSASLFLSHGDTSTFNGNLSVYRTAPGYVRAFNSGGNIIGNFTFNNTSSGDNDLGNLATATNISGTINMNVNLSPIGGFAMHRLINQTAGGKINIQNSRGFNVQSDTLKVDSLNIIWYRGNSYAYYFDNKLIGNLTLADSADYGGGYSTHLRNNTITGNSTFRTFGINAFYEADAINQPNIFNGNVSMIILGTGPVYTNHSAKSTINGNFTISRTVPGYTRLFASGADITGNFTYTKNAGGASDLGVFGSKTSIGGTININGTQTNGDAFSIRRIQNYTNGGSIVLQNIQGMDVQQDSLLLSSFSITGYGGNAYAYFFNNLISGNLNLQDNAAYSSGYSTNIQNNTINGNSVFTILGNNNLGEGNAANMANTFNGNVSFYGNGNGGLYISPDAASTYNGNVYISRNTAGVTNAFYNGATINGNLSFVKSVGGSTHFGSTNQRTSISGTLNMSVNQSLNDPFNMFWLVNNTSGGSINVQTTKAFNIQKDSLKVANFSISEYGGSGYAYFLNNQIEGGLNIADDASYTAGYNTTFENNTIYGNTVFTNNGTNLFNDAGGANSGNIYQGNVTYIRNGGNFNIATGDTNSYAGDFIQETDLNLNVNFIRFIGNTSSSINQLGTADVIIPNLMMNKTGAGAVTLNKPVLLINSCNFFSGDILSTNVNPLIFLNDATQNGANDNSHIIGTALKIGDDAFTFPLGNGIGLNTIGISAPSSTLDTFEARIVINNASLDGFPLASKDAALVNIEPFHYWTLNRISGSNPVTVTLGWGNPCVNAGINDLPTLAVSRWNGSLWSNLGNGGTSGNNASGTVSMAGNTNSFGPFILASTSNLNLWTGFYASISGTNSPICSGASTVLTASGAATYTWEPGGLSGNPVTVSPLVTTTYTVTAASPSGCLTTATKTITVNIMPNLSTTVTTAAVCTGASSTITVSGANTYIWQPGALTGASNTVTPASTTVYTITGTHANGCTNTTTRMITVGTCASCGTDVVISTSPYSILLTESTTFIETNGTVVIDSGAYVKFDAAPAYYILLKPGFLAKTGSVFIAQPLNGCIPGSPQEPSYKVAGIQNATELPGDIFIYPNPTSGKISINHPADLTEISIFDLMGKKVMPVRLSGNTQTDIDIGALPNGVYILYAKGYTNIKIIKN